MANIPPKADYESRTGEPFAHASRLSRIVQTTYQNTSTEKNVAVGRVVQIGKLQS